MHHTFAHAKVLAEILDYDLYKNHNEETLLPRETSTGISYYNDINTYQFNKDDMHATVSSYDWEYMPGGHASGGSITMLWHKLTGAILCASMSDYSLKELNNMQLPRFEHHECLTPRLELQEDGIKYSTVYDFCSEIEHRVMQDCTSIFAKGMLVDILHRTPNTDARHKTEYRFEKNKLTVSSQVHSGDLHFICPLISSCTEQVIINANSITIEKEFATVCLEVIKGTLKIPYNEKRIYNLVPGFQVVKTDIYSTDSKIEFTITITEKIKQ